MHAKSRNSRLADMRVACESLEEAVEAAAVSRRICGHTPLRVTRDGETVLDERRLKGALEDRELG